MEWIIVFVEQIGFGDLITGRKRGTTNPNKIKNPNKVMAMLLGDKTQPFYCDSDGWMYPETVRKIMKKMPGVWEKYLAKYNIATDLLCTSGRTLELQLSLSNFLAYLKTHKEEWAYVECNIDCFGNDDFYKPDDCMGCDGKNRQIINPEYAEVIKEMEGKG
jgi:hypothetical protein